MDGVHVAISDVDADSLQGEAVLLARAMDKDGRPQTAEAERQVSIWGGISG